MRARNEQVNVIEVGEVNVNTAAPTRAQQAAKPPAGRTLLMLALIAVAAIVVRLDNLTERTFGHPENFVTGLNVPDWVQYPPPRNDLAGIYRGTLIDGHPPGYFVAMLPWVKTFGSSLLALRMPSVILGVLGVLLVFYLCRKETDDVTALLAAALLAFNGHHIFWSQQARMYALAAAMALASSILLWRILEYNRRGDRWWYFIVTAGMLWVQLYCWPVLLAQMLWATVHAVRQRSWPVALKLQIAAIIAGSPVIQLSMYQNPPTQWKQSAIEYFGFGYLYYSESLFFGERHPLAALSLPLSILGVVMVVLALKVLRGRQPIAQESDGHDQRAFSASMIAVAAVATAILVAFPLTAPAGKAGRAVLLAVAALPAMLLIGLAICYRVWPHLAARMSAWRWLNVLPMSLSLWLALVPWLVMYSLSVARPSFVARGALIFVPYLLIVFAMMIRALSRHRVVMGAALALVVLLHAGSVIYFRHVESSGRDYETLANNLKAQLQPADVILMRNRFAQPPLLYYLPDQLNQVVPIEAARNGVDPSKRVWVLVFERSDSNVFKVVGGRTRVRSVGAYGGEAILYAPVTR